MSEAESPALSLEPSASGVDVAERRAHRRYPTLLPATVELSRGLLSVVTVLDLSGGGALLRFPPGTEAPHAFKLAVSTGGEAALLDCRETSREPSWTGTLVHVRFEGLTPADQSFISSVLAALRPEFDEYQQFLVARTDG